MPHLGNGLTVPIQPMPWLRTAALSLNLQAVHREPAHLGGLSSLVCEMIQRGAGQYSSRDLVAAQDNLGIDRNSGVSTAFVSFGASMPSDSLPAAISLYADIVRNPHLPHDQLEDARMMAIQELRAMEDEPTHRVMRRLRELHYGEVLGRSNFGTETGIQQITQDDIRSFYQTNYHSSGGILSIAGNVDPTEVLDCVNTAFGNWRTGSLEDLPCPSGVATYEHFESSSSQTHIGFAFDAIPYATRIISSFGGMGIWRWHEQSAVRSRREQRGLCYTVTASCHSLKMAEAYSATQAQRLNGLRRHSMSHFMRLKISLKTCPK